MTIDHDDTSYEPPHATSPTDHVLNELQLHGYRPFQDEPDPRPMPEARTIAGAVADIFDALVATLSDTRLEPDLEDLLWSTVNLFHRANERIERQLDDNEQAQKRCQREQDGSEFRSVELERLTAEGMTLIERRNSASTRTWCCCTADRRRAASIAARWADHRKVPQIAFKPDWARHAKPRRSGGTTPCWRCCRSACWLPRAPASRRTSPTKRGGSAFRSGSSAAAAHERRRSSKLLRRYCLASTDRVS